MASSRILQFAKRTGHTAKRAVEVGYIKPTLEIAPYVGGFFGLVCIKNGYNYSRNKERCIPRALVHGAINGVTGGLFAYGMTWFVVPAMIGGFTMWAIGDMEFVVTKEGDTTTTEVENASGFTIMNKTRKTTTTKKTAIDGVDMDDLNEAERQHIDQAFDIIEKRRQAKWEDVTVYEQGR